MVDRASPVEIRQFPRLDGATPIDPIVSEIEQGNQTCTVATHAEWGCAKFLSSHPVPGATLPLLQGNATLLPPKFAQPSLKPRMERLLTSYFTFSHHLTSCRLRLNPRPVTGRLLSRQSTLLYHSAVQPCYCL